MIRKERESKWITCNVCHWLAHVASVELKFGKKQIIMNQKYIPIPSSSSLQWFTSPFRFSSSFSLLSLFLSSQVSIDLSTLRFNNLHKTLASVQNLTPSLLLFLPIQFFLPWMLLPQNVTFGIFILNSLVNDSKESERGGGKEEEGIEERRKGNDMMRRRERYWKEGKMRSIHGWWEKEEKWKRVSIKCRDWIHEWKEKMNERVIRWKRSVTKENTRKKNW